MSTTVSNPSVGTGENFDAQEAFASILAVADGEQKQGEAPEEEVEVEVTEPESETEAEAEDLQSEEEAESEEPEESEEQEEQPPIYKVKVDGEEVEVTLDELQKGYSRTQDYTRKTQALADQRKAVEAELGNVRQEREYYAQVLNKLEQQLAQADNPPDWDRLYQENPTEWVRQRELWRDKQDKVKAIAAEKERIASLNQEEMAKTKQAQLAEEAKKLVDAIPEWKDSKRASEEKAKLVDAARRVGYSESELNEVMDHRAVVLLRKAALFDELMSKKTQIKPVPAKGPKTSKPGSAGTQPTKASEARRAQERLAKTGNMRDAVAAFDNFI
jgi:hypothetical protein